MKEWLKKNLFEEQPSFEKKGPPLAPSNTPKGGFSVPTGPATPGLVTYGHTPVTNLVNSEMREQLVSSIKAVVDPKYSQFKNMNDSMKTVLTDSKQRFSAAFLAVKAQTGVTKSQLIQGANLMLQALKKERAHFEDEINGATQKIETSIGERAQKMQVTIQAKQQQIQQLTAEVDQIQNEHSIACANINNQRVEIEKTKAEFFATEAELDREITNEITDLTTYIME